MKKTISIFIAMLFAISFSANTQTPVLPDSATIAKPALPAPCLPRVTSTPIDSCCIILTIDNPCDEEIIFNYDVTAPDGSVIDSDTRKIPAGGTQTAGPICPGSGVEYSLTYESVVCYTIRKQIPLLACDTIPTDTIPPCVITEGDINVEINEDGCCFSITINNPCDENATFSYDVTDAEGNIFPSDSGDIEGGEPYTSEPICPGSNGEYSFTIWINDSISITKTIALDACPEDTPDPCVITAEDIYNSIEISADGCCFNIIINNPCEENVAFKYDVTDAEGNIFPSASGDIEGGKPYIGEQICPGSNGEYIYTIWINDSISITKNITLKDCPEDTTKEEPDCFEAMKKCAENGGVVGNLLWYNQGSKDPAYGFYDNAGNPIKDPSKIFEEIWEILEGYANSCCSKEQILSKPYWCNDYNVTRGTDVTITVCFPGGKSDYDAFFQELYNKGYGWHTAGIKSSVSFEEIKIEDIYPNSPATRCWCGG